MRMDSCDSEKGPAADFCEHSSEPSGAINGGQFDDLCDCQHFKSATS